MDMSRDPRTPLRKPEEPIKALARPEGCDGISLVLERHDLLRGRRYAWATLEQFLKGLSPVDQRPGVTGEQREEPVFARHKRLKPAEHGNPSRRREQFVTDL